MKKEALLQQLVARSQELTEQIQRLRADLVCAADVGDATDRAQRDSSFGTVEGLIRLADEELSLIISALENPSAYGRCIQCGEEISPARLSAVPWANRCCACQTELEMPMNRHFGSAHTPSVH